MRAALTSLIKTSSGEHILSVRHYARSGLANDDLLVFHFGSAPVERNAQTLELRGVEPPSGTIRIVPNRYLRDSNHSSQLEPHAGAPKQALFSTL